MLVVTADGAPAIGVLVAFGLRRFGRFEPRLNERATEAPAGAVRIDGLDLAWDDAEQGEWGVAVPLLDDAVFAPIDPRSPPSEAVVLRLRSLAQLEVHLVDAAGKPVAARGAIECFAVSGGFADPDRRCWTLIADGEGRVEGLSPGVQVVLQVSAEGLRTPFESLVQLPSAGAPPVRLEVAVEPALRAIRGRLITPEGVALSHWRILAVLSTARRTTGWSEETDGAGAFELPFTEVARDWSGATVTIHERPHGSGIARAELPADAAPGEVDLGDLVLQPQPLFVAGRVVDSQGRPVVGARVSVRLGRELAEAESERVDPWEWPSLAVDEQGRFEMHADLAVDAAELRCERPLAPEIVVPFAVGARDVEVVVPVTGRIAGELLLERESAARSLLVEVRRSGEASDGATQSLAGLDSPRFVLPSLEEGEWDVLVSLLTARQPLPLATIERVRVEGGRTTVDPRLAPLDLRGRFVCVNVTAVDEDGRAVHRTVARLLDAASGEEVARANIDERAGDFTLAVRDATLLVDAPGFLGAEVPHARDVVRVVLRRARPTALTVTLSPAVVARWNAARAAAGGDLDLLVRLDDPTARSSEPLPWRCTRFSDEGIAIIHVDRPGPSRLRLLLSGEIELGDGASIENDGRAEISCELPVTVEQFEAALAVLERDE